MSGGAQAGRASRAIRPGPHLPKTARRIGMNACAVAIAD